nr:unnamed protein product [Callosobruchus analis]
MERLDLSLIQEPWVSNEGRIFGLGNCQGRNRTRSTSSSSAGANHLLQEEQQTARVGMRRKRPPYGLEKFQHKHTR